MIKHLSLLAVTGLLMVAPLGVFAQDGEASEAAAAAPAASPAGPNVEASVEQLERLINLPQPARLGRESEERSTPSNVFVDPATRERLLGKNPRFVYFPEGPDPMIVTWLRDAILAQELLDDARLARTNQDLKGAEAKLAEMIERFPATEAARQGQRELTEVRREIQIADTSRRPGPQSGPPVVAPPVVTQQLLPPWVVQNTNGVMLTKIPSVLVGDHILTVGQSVPRFAGVKVKRIEESRVVYEFQGQEFPIEVVGQF